MNGVWFWWCNKKGPGGFKKLWIALYDRFVNHHKLDNLLWVWNSNAPRDNTGNEAYAYEDYYPGNEYVDILAADIYGKYEQSHHDDLDKLSQGKPIAIGEMSKLPDKEVLEKQPQWAWAMPWGKFTFVDKFNTDQEVKSFYNNPQVKSLDDLCVHNASMKDS